MWSAHVIGRPTAGPPDSFDVGSHPHGFSRGQKVGWHGSWVPPGWSKGRKTGWNGHHVPPGWFKGRKSGWNGHHAPHGLHSEMDDDHQD